MLQCDRLSLLSLLCPSWLSSRTTGRDSVGASGCGSFSYPGNQVVINLVAILRRSYHAHAFPCIFIVTARQLLQDWVSNHPSPTEADADPLLSLLAEPLSVLLLLLSLLLLLLLLLPLLLSPPEELLLGGGGVAEARDEDELPEDILLQVEKMVEGSMKLLKPLSEPELHRNDGVSVLCISCIYAIYCRAHFYAQVKEVTQVQLNSKNAPAKYLQTAQ